MPVVGDIVGGRYEIRQKLGGGGQGAVWRAFDTRLQTDVAIKFQLGVDESETTRQRFEQEALVAARIKHPNVVGILDYGEHESLFYYVMEYFPDGLSLERLVQNLQDEGKLLPLDVVHDLFLDAAAGIAAIHAAGVIHRDIKLANFLVYTTAELEQKRYRLKILDLGVAHTDAKLTQTGTFLATPIYAAPEAFEGATPDERMDEFSLGVAFYEVLTGVSPFHVKSESGQVANTFAICKAVRSHHPPQPSHVREGMPSGWDVLIMTLLAKSPNERFPTLSHVMTAAQDLHKLGEWVAPEVPIAPEGSTVDLGPAMQIDSQISKIRLDNIEDGDSDDAGAGLPAEEDDDGLDTPVGADEPQALEQPEFRKTESLGKPRARAPAPVSKDAELESAASSVDGMDSAAANLANRLAAGKRPALSTLGPRYKLAIAAAAAALLLLFVIIVTGRRHEEVQVPHEFATSSKEAPKHVTANDLIGDERRARREALVREHESRRVEEQDRIELADAAAPSEVPVKRRPSRRKKRRRKAAKTSTTQTTPAAGAMPVGVSSDDGTVPLDELYSSIDFDPGSDGAATKKKRAGAKLGVPSGAEIAARLERALNSQNPKTPAVAVVLSSFSLPGEGVLIPRGSKVFGRATFNDLETSARVQIQFHKIVFPDRTERKIAAIATSPNGDAGIPAQRAELDDRATSNAGEAALDVAKDLLSDKPGGDLADRFIDDKRSDLRKRRRSQVKITAKKHTKLKVFFTEGI